MTPRPTTPRLAPLREDECTEAQREVLADVGGPDALNIFATLARYPRLFRRWSPFAGKLLRGGRLADRDRELVILRTALLTEAGYEWGQHVAIGRTAGLSDDEIGQIAIGPQAPGWSDEDRSLLTAVDELIGDRCVTDGTWAQLASRYDEEELIEITMLAGSYAMLAGTLNSLGVQLEGDQPALGQS
jgi:4-carboxymuconolactone decarboxylase